MTERETDTLRRETLRYLGYGRQPADAETDVRISRLLPLLRENAAPKTTYVLLPLAPPQGDTLLLGNTAVTSRALTKNLTGCRQIICFAATLGAATDRLLRRTEVSDMADAVILQACAAAYIEQVCDRAQEEIARTLPAGQYLRPRFSPGYGDFDMAHQKALVTLTDCGRRIGLYLTAGGMLTPVKSVTAVMGIADGDEPCTVHGCEACKKTDCAYRRTEEGAT